MSPTLAHLTAGDDSELLTVFALGVVIGMAIVLSRIRRSERRLQP